MLPIELCHAVVASQLLAQSVPRCPPMMASLEGSYFVQCKPAAASGSGMLLIA
jgi:hypothetical protein